MSETPQPPERSPTRTIVLALLSVCFPPLGAVLVEMGSGIARLKLALP
jgi:hypothetical protein